MMADFLSLILKTLTAREREHKRKGGSGGTNFSNKQSNRIVADSRRDDVGTVMNFVVHKY
jgi:hypothetical protein